MIRISAHDRDEWRPEVALDDLPSLLGQPECRVWIDLEDGVEQELAALAERFGLHPLAIEDVYNPEQRPKVDVYDDHLFIVIYDVSRDEAQLKIREVDLFVGADWLITIHERPIPALSQVQARWQQNAPAIGRDIGTLLYTVLDTLLDGYFPLLDRIVVAVDQLEEEVFSEFDPDQMRRLVALKHDLLLIRRVVGPQRDVVSALLRDDHAILPTAIRPYLHDLYDHSLRIVERTDIYREMAGSVTEAVLSIQSNQVNEVMKRLTVINILFLPLAVLTGFFGMNFTMMPFEDPGAMVLALLLMAALPATLFGWLKLRGLE